MATPGLEVMELGPEEPVVLLPAGHALADRPFLTLTEIEALPGYAAQLPNEALDTMVDRVALGQLVIVIGESIRDRLGQSVRAVPVHGYPPTQLVLAWLPDARPAASRLTATAQTVMRGARRGRRRRRALTSAEPGRTRKAVSRMHSERQRQSAARRAIDEHRARLRALLPRY
ncbi:hypothetical protein ACWDZW_12940 [Streptomyces coeruleorubidus]|uniref:hypothetical protein n=1 Tax=Streptomyces coeruleorubidus TaxID=116188 RepID=UPI0033F465C6